MTKRLIKTDRMMSLYRDEQGAYRPHGKRVSNNFPLTRYERRFYIANNGSAIRTVGFLMKNRDMSLSEAWTLLKSARYPVYSVARNGTRTLLCK